MSASFVVWSAVHLEATTPHEWSPMMGRNPSGSSERQPALKQTPPRVLITAGPTHEPLDAVRFLGNRSSGRLGIALAEASVKRGWQTTLLLGPTSRTPVDHPSLTTQRFQSTADLQSLLGRCWPDHDLLLMAAAVADFRPRHPVVDEKITRRSEGLTLELEPTPDLLAELSQSNPGHGMRVGWALEPQNRLRESARRKLKAKNVHALVANPLNTISDEAIRPLLLLDDGDERTPPDGSLLKPAFAEWLLDQIEPLMAEAN